MSESLWGKLTGSLDNLTKKIKGVTSNPTPSPLTSNATSINGGTKRNNRRKRTKKVRFSKKNKVFSYKSKSLRLRKQHK